MTVKKLFLEQSPIAAKLSRLGSVEVRDREFQLHKQVTAQLGVEFYFPPPPQPLPAQNFGLQNALGSLVFSTVALDYSLFLY